MATVPHRAVAIGQINGYGAVYTCPAGKRFNVKEIAFMHAENSQVWFHFGTSGVAWLIFNKSINQETHIYSFDITLNQNESFILPFGPSGTLVAHLSGLLEDV